MVAFREASIKSFHERVAEYLRQRAPVALSIYSRDELLERIAIACKRAGKYGFEQASSYVAFAELTFAVSPAFDEHPGIHKILTEAHLPPDVRMSFLADDITDAQWEEARAYGKAEPVAPSRSMVAADGRQ